MGLQHMGLGRLAKRHEEALASKTGDASLQAVCVAMSKTSKKLPYLVKRGEMGDIVSLSLSRRSSLFLCGVLDAMSGMFATCARLKNVRNREELVDVSRSSSQSLEACAGCRPT